MVDTTPGFMSENTHQAGEEDMCVCVEVIEWPRARVSLSLYGLCVTYDVCRQTHAYLSVSCCEYKPLSNQHLRVESVYISPVCLSDCFCLFSSPSPLRDKLRKFCILAMSHSPSKERMLFLYLHSLWPDLRQMEMCNIVCRMRELCIFL